MTSKFEDNFNRCYRQYIQFINEQQFSKEAISLLFFFQSLSITCTLLSKVSVTEPLLTISLFGVHNLLAIISNINLALKIIIIMIMALLLLIAFVVPLHLIYQSYTKKHIKNGQFKKKCESTIFHQMMRTYLIMFEYVFLPTYLYYSLNLANILVTIFVCTICLIIVIAVDYHILEIIYKEENRIIKLGFPYKLFDTAIYMGIIIIANSEDHNTCYFGVFFGNIIRLILSHFLNFYTLSVEKQHQIYLIINQVALLGILVAVKSSHAQFVLFNASILAAIVYWKRQKLMRLVQTWKKTEKLDQCIDEQQQYFQDTLKSKQLSSIQFRFQKHGHFAGIFRKLIILGKKSIENREFLVIEVLKSKCYGIEINSRGTAAKIMDCETVMKNESLLKQIVCLVLEISNRSISILRLLKMRDEFTYIFNQEVQVLIKYVNDLKDLIRELMKINEWSLEGQAILTIMFAKIMRDQAFLQEIKQLRKVNKKQSDKSLKIHLFSEKTVMVFVNMLDEMGKIVKTSKNLPTILGYNPNQLEGIEIDSLLLASMKNYHIQHMTNFIDRYDKKSALNPRNVLFYINNHNYELQKIDVSYNFVMSSFNLFHMCGIIKKIDFEGDIVILNKYGNVEGFTKKIGIQLGLNVIAGPDMNKYNVLCLIPSLIKYGDKATKLKTMFFKVKNMSSNVWKIHEKIEQKSISKLEIMNYVYELFLQLLEDDIIEGYYVEVETNNVVFFHDQVDFKVIIIKNYQKVMNFCQLKQKIENGMKEDELCQETERRTIVETDVNLYLDDEQKQNFDTNFCCDENKPSVIKLKQLQIDEFDVQDGKSFEAIEVQEPEEDKTIAQKQNNLISNGMNKVKIERDWKCLDLLIVIILCFVGLIVYDYTSLDTSGKELQIFNKQILLNKKAFSIILKSLYYPNKEDIDNFRDNQLINRFSDIMNDKFNYTTFYNGSIIYNDYYLFNIHIPTLLKNIISEDTNIVAQGITELNININKIILEEERIFSRIMQAWNSNVNYLYVKCTIILTLMIIAVCLFLIIGICMIIYRRQQLVTYQAFFKFEKEDLEEKIEKIKTNIKQLQSQVIKWYLSKEFHNYVKEGNIFNLQFHSVTTIYEPRIGFEVNYNKEQSIKNNENYRYIFYISLYVIIQILLCVFYLTQTRSFIQDLKTIPQQIDQCSKIMVTPSLLLASVNRTLPSNIITNYVNATQSCISKTINSLPSLIQFVATPPCLNCTFLYPYLTTNYISYFNSFEQMVILMKGGQFNAANLTEMIEAASVVTANLEKELYYWQTINPSLVVSLCYLISIAIIIAVTWFNIKKINQEIKCAETFLQLFDKEMIENNMRMANLLEKKQ